MRMILTMMFLILPFSSSCIKSSVRCSSGVLVFDDVCGNMCMMAMTNKDMYRILFISRVSKKTKPNKISSGMLQRNDRDICSVCIEAQPVKSLKVAKRVMGERRGETKMARIPKDTFKVFS